MEGTSIIDRELGFQWLGKMRCNYAFLKCHRTKPHLKPVLLLSSKCSLINLLISPVKKTTKPPRLK